MTLIVAVCASIFATNLIIINSAILPSPQSESIAMIIAIAFGAAIPSSFYAAFHRGLFLKKINPFSDPRSIISELSLIQVIVILYYNTHKIQPAMFFAAVVILQSWATWLSFAIALNGIKIPKKFTAKVPWFATAAVGGFGLLAFPIRNFWPTESLLVAFAIWQAAVHIIGLCAVLTWFSLYRRFRLDQSSVLESLRMRIDSADKRISEWTSSLFTAFLQLAGILGIVAIIKHQQPDYPLVFALAAPVLYLPSLIDAWTRLDKVGAEQDKLLAFSRLTIRSAKNLLIRHNRGKDNWAATVGLRTTTFTIDHDLESNIAKKLSRTLTRIRNEEVAAIINQIMKTKILALSSISQKILGSIDPEQSIRPCVDALNLCSTLYLDAGALVERRLSGFASLLPLVNQGLADAIDLESVLPLLKKSQWFFYFEYSWVDQSIVNTPSESHYGIHLEPISSEAKTAMLDFMRRTHSVGNFIWIGKEAHHRLLQEAPNLTTIMEPHTIQVTGEQEMLLFAIKFEHLIPRLQRYYGLDETRAKIVDFEPGSEAQRLLKIMLLQTDNSKTTHDKLRIIDSIASYTWRGFKEKDQALNLLLKIYQAEIDKNHNVERKSSGTDSIMKSLRDAVTTIGYPSQILNQAQLFKIELRDIAKLRMNALDPHSSRFEEAWVLIGNLDYRRHKESEIKSIRQILGDAMRDQTLMKAPLVQGKLIDATVALIRRDNGDELTLDLKLLVRVTETMIQTKAGAECMSLALDALTFVARLTEKPMPLSEVISQYFDQLLTKGEKSDAWSQSLKNRWQEYKSNYLTDSQGRKSA